MSDVKPCGYCGTIFARDVRNSRAYFARAKYCSLACSGKALVIRRDAERPPMREKFQQQIRIAGGCWEWTGIKDKDGYGLFPYNKVQHRANKVALELDGRPVPRGMYACHHCDNPGCVRPSHLYPGTPKQNSSDAMARGRIVLGKKAKLTVSDVIAIRTACGTHAAIAARFNVTPSNVTMIRTRRTWRNVP